MHRTQSRGLFEQSRAAVPGHVLRKLVDKRDRTGEGNVEDFNAATVNLSPCRLKAATGKQALHSELSRLKAKVDELRSKVRMAPGVLFW